ncbi:type III-B CRISPR module RAMP protein Cmr6 [Hyalangium versicolor]|uniref:type III-B CRISPR module RAMP protein Cmr6 n=1 Tax=Hyalangium versicolor TaxID=2861190 RepID=UPI001CC94BF3|nr:type III-B CRISPR module RAMP protein Cmr6 [Hyalangium versicolor]
MWLAPGPEREDRAWLEKAIPSHAGLAHERWAPLPVLLAKEAQGSTERNQWMDRLAQCREPERYAHAYRRWEDSLKGPDILRFTVRALGRVLVGHGNPTATGVGLTLHHTWGVPMLPGSALKGLTANYVQAVYGPGADPGTDERDPFRGLTWKGPRPIRGAGWVFRLLFGSPDVDTSGEEALAGKIRFHDALWVPTKASPMLARDVLTVHQRRYYESGGTQWPGDFDDPNPVSFLTLAPGGCFLIALELSSGVEEGQVLLERAGRYVAEALEEWGLGGKTSAGYGRFVREDQPATTGQARTAVRPLQELTSAALTELKTWLEEQKATGVGQREQFRLLERNWKTRLLGLGTAEQRAAAHLIKKYLRLKREAEQQQLNALLSQLGGSEAPPSNSRD